MKKTNNLERLYELALEENAEELKEVLEENKIDLNKVITIHENENNDTYFYDGDLTKNWEELIKGNWNGTKYAGQINNDCIYSETVYELLTSQGSDEVEEAIEEVYPDFKAENKQSMILNLEDILTDAGYLKITMIDDRYLITDDEKDNFEEWLEEDEEEYKIKARDILEDEEVEFLVKADQKEAYENSNKNLGFLNMELVK